MLNAPLEVLGTQIALAQHAGVHFSSHESFHSHESGNDQNAPDSKELCQICLSGKIYTSALKPNGIELKIVLSRAAYEIACKSAHIRQQTSHAYLARAPPSFLI
jgi:hypothetical protein